MPGLALLRVAPPGAPAEDGVLDFHTPLMTQPEDHLTFGGPGRDDNVAAYFHTGGTTVVPKLVAHTHRGQLVAALGGAVLGDMRASDTLTATLPLFHVGGTIFCGLSAFMAGVGLVVMSPGGLRTPAMVQGFWQLVAQHGATLVGAVPIMIDGATFQVGISIGHCLAAHGERDASNLIKQADIAMYQDKQLKPLRKAASDLRAPGGFAVTTGSPGLIGSFYIGY